jgi:hypothetical protein
MAAPAVDPALLPPVKSAVQVRAADGRLWATRVALRDGGRDYLDAPRAADGRPAPAPDVRARYLLVWGAGDTALAYPIRVVEVLPPLGAWVIRYEAPPTRVNRRREVRLAAAWPLRLIGPDGRPFDTVTRDVSPSAVRAFTPQPLPPGVRLLAVLTLPDGRHLAATVQVHRIAAALSHWRGAAGQDVVLRFDPPLAGEAQALWRRACQAPAGS